MKKPVKKIIHGKQWKIGPIIMITPHLCASTIFTTGFWMENVKLS